MALISTRFHHQVLFAIEAMLMHTYALSNNRVIKKSFAMNLSEKCIELLEMVENKRVELEDAVKMLNQLIAGLNKHALGFPVSPAYPAFTLSDERLQVTNQIFAFQGFVNEEFKLGNIDHNGQSVLFKEAAELWKESLAPNITPKEAMRGLSNLIQRGNTYLSKDEKYPLPKPEYYSTKI